MKTLKDIINENKIDDAIDTALKMMQTVDDIEALGEAFGKKYQNSILESLKDFLYSVSSVTKKQNIKDKIDSLVKSL